MCCSCSFDKTTCAGCLKGFQVGDIVEWWGATGKVVSTNHVPDYPILVNFKNGERRNETFTQDGRYRREHTTPSLKFVSRPKRIVKKEVKRWVVIDSDEIIRASCTEERDACHYSVSLPCKSWVVELTGTYEVEE